MPLTLDQARQKLYKYVSPSLDTVLVTEKINSAMERIYNSGKWKGLMTVVSFYNLSPSYWWSSDPVPYITLPRKFQSISGIQYGASGQPALPRQVYPRWQEFIAGGGGELSSGTSMQMAVDMGDGFVTDTDPTAPFYVTFKSYDPQDSGVVVQFSGLDAAGNPAYDSKGNAFFTVPVNTIVTSTTFSQITSVSKPVTEGKISLFAVNPTNATSQNSIADYEATETVPQYKRYRLAGSEFAQRVNCLCKRRYVALVDGPDDDTILLPDNEGALKLTLMALQYEDKNDLERAEEYFNKAIQLLNAELKEDMGNPVITLQMNPLGAAMRIPARY
jgi:hypothetical protein